MAHVAALCTEHLRGYTLKRMPQPPVQLSLPGIPLSEDSPEYQEELREFLHLLKQWVERQAQKEPSASPMG